MLEHLVGIRRVRDVVCLDVRVSISRKLVSFFGHIRSVSTRDNNVQRFLHCAIDDVRYGEATLRILRGDNRSLPVLLTFQVEFGLGDGVANCDIGGGGRLFRTIVSLVVE